MSLKLLSGGNHSLSVKTAGRTRHLSPEQITVFAILTSLNRAIETYSNMDHSCIPTSMASLLFIPVSQRHIQKAVLPNKEQC